MSKQGSLLWILFLLTFFAFWGSAQAEPIAKHIAGEYVVRLYEPQNALTAQSLTAQTSAFSARSVTDSSSRLMVVEKSLLELPEAVIEDLEANPMVARAEPNYIYEASLLPDDSRLGDLWGLANPLKNSGGVDIDAEAAWDITTGSSGIVVAVIDTGVDYLDPDLANNMWVNVAEQVGEPGVDDDGNGFVDDIHGYDFANNDGDPMDDNNHGTHCAGTIGAEGDNGIGVVGVNWQVQIMALKFLTGSGSGSLEGALKSIDYATAQGVDVMSNSWGGGGRSELLKEAIERARDAGILFIAAAGNERNDNDANPTYPANYEVDNVISVAAVDRQGRLASFSNFGEQTVDIAAPGVDILSTGVNGLISLSGTSMATPHVSGVAALLLADQPGLNYLEVKDRLLATAQPLNSLSGKVSTGLVNAFQALVGVSGPIDPEPIEEDPSQWSRMAESAETAHPYANNESQIFEFVVPGAEKVAVHFETFELENRYDTVIIMDGLGQEVGVMTGSQSGSYSPVVEGDTIILKFESDFSISRFGFVVDHIAYVGGAQGSQWMSFPDPVSTPHPYERNFDGQAVFKAPGASQVKLKFGRFEIEERYDQVIFYDGQGQELGRWDGNHSGEFSPVAEGDEIILRFRSDFSIQGYGFDVESVYFLEGGSL